jgi:CheY-like chemotaxis protein
MTSLPCSEINVPSPPAVPRILIVDDDPLIRELHTLVLNLDGYEVEAATDGADALERLAAEHFDLIVTDRSMPNLDGASMVFALRSAGSRIPIVMVSGSLSHSPLTHRLAREITVSVPKPARSAEIRSAVALALRSHPADFPQEYADWVDA